MIEILPSLPSESEILSDIAIESKGHWGYSREQLEIWRKDLKIEEEYIQEHTVCSIWKDSEIVTTPTRSTRSRTPPPRSQI